MLNISTKVISFEKKDIKIIVVWNKETLVSILTPILGQYGLKPVDFLDKLAANIVNTYPLFKEYLIQGPYQEQNSILSYLNMSLTVIVKFFKSKYDFILNTPSIGFLYNFYYRGKKFNYLFFYKLLVVKSFMYSKAYFKKLYISLVFSLIKHLSW